MPDFLIRVDGASEQDVELLLGAANDDEQELCNPTMQSTGRTIAYPEVRISVPEFPIYIDSGEVAFDALIYDLSFTNVLPEGIATAREGVVSLILDMRQVAPFFTIVNGEPDAVCAILEAELQAPCEPCPRDGEAYCITMRAEQLGATTYSCPAMQEIAQSSRSVECVQ